MVQERDEFNFHPTVSETPGISLVFFTGPHCSSCHHLRDLLNVENQCFVDHFSRFSAFEIKADKAAALVNEYNVFHLPTMFLFQNGEFHCELHAQAIPSKIIEAIDNALLMPADEEP